MADIDDIGEAESSGDDSISITSTVDSQHSADHEFEIGRILAERCTSGGGHEYFIEWRDYDESYNTWEPPGSFVNANEVLQGWDNGEKHTPYDLAAWEAREEQRQRDRIIRKERRRRKRRRLDMQGNAIPSAPKEKVAMKPPNKRAQKRRQGHASIRRSESESDNLSIAKSPKGPANGVEWTGPEQNTLLKALQDAEVSYWDEILRLYGQRGTIDRSLKDKTASDLAERMEELRNQFLDAGKEPPKYLLNFRSREPENKTPKSLSVIENSVQTKEVHNGSKGISSSSKEASIISEVFSGSERTMDSLFDGIEEKVPKQRATTKQKSKPKRKMTPALPKQLVKETSPTKSTTYPTKARLGANIARPVTSDEACSNKSAAKTWEHRTKDPTRSPEGVHVSGRLEPAIEKEPKPPSLVQTTSNPAQMGASGSGPSTADAGHRLENASAGEAEPGIIWKSDSKPGKTLLTTNTYEKPKTFKYLAYQNRVQKPKRMEPAPNRDNLVLIDPRTRKNPPALATVSKIPLPEPQKDVAVEIAMRNQAGESEGTRIGVDAMAIDEARLETPMKNVDLSRASEDSQAGDMNDDLKIIAINKMSQLPPAHMLPGVISDRESVAHSQDSTGKTLADAVSLPAVQTSRNTQANSPSNQRKGLKPYSATESSKQNADRYIPCSHPGTMLPANAEACNLSQATDRKDKLPSASKQLAAAPLAKISSDAATDAPPSAPKGPKKNMERQTELSPTHTTKHSAPTIDYHPVFVASPNQLQGYSVASDFVLITNPTSDEKLDLWKKYDRAIVVGQLRVKLADKDDMKSFRVKFSGMGLEIHKLLLTIKIPPNTMNFDFTKFCLAAEYHKYFPTESYLGAGSILAYPPAESALQRIVETLAVTLSGGLFFAKNFTMVIFPPGASAWAFLESCLPPVHPGTVLRFVVREPLAEDLAKDSSAITRLAIDNPERYAEIKSHVDSTAIASGEKNINIVFHDMFEIEYRRLVSQNGPQRCPLAHVFFLCFIPQGCELYEPDTQKRMALRRRTSREHDFFIEFLEANGAEEIYSMQDIGSINVANNGAWDYFLRNVKSGTIIFHDACITQDLVPGLAKCLRESSISVWKTSFSPMHPAEKHPHLVRLFPHGGVILITESLILYQPQKALQIIRWFRRIQLPAKPLGTWKLATRPRIRTWLLDLMDVCEDRNKDIFGHGVQVIADIYTEIYWLFEATDPDKIGLMCYDFDPEIPTDEAPIVTAAGLHPLQSRNEWKGDTLEATEIDYENIKQNDELLLQWFAEWAMVNLQSFRKFHAVLGSSNGDDFGDKAVRQFEHGWGHLEVLTPEQCCSRHKVSSQEELAKIEMERRRQVRKKIPITREEARKAQMEERSAAQKALQARIKMFRDAGALEQEPNAAGKQFLRDSGATEHEIKNWNIDMERSLVTNDWERAQLKEAETTKQPAAVAKTRNTATEPGSDNDWEVFEKPNEMVAEAMDVDEGDVGGYGLGGNLERDPDWLPTQKPSNKKGKRFPKKGVAVKKSPKEETSKNRNGEKRGSGKPKSSGIWKPGRWAWADD